MNKSKSLQNLLSVKYLIASHQGAYCYPKAALQTYPLCYNPAKKICKVEIDTYTKIPNTNKWLLLDRTSRKLTFFLSVPNTTANDVTKHGGNTHAHIMFENNAHKYLHSHDKVPTSGTHARGCRDKHQSNSSTLVDLSAIAALDLAFHTSFQHFAKFWQGCVHKYISST